MDNQFGDYNYIKELSDEMKIVQLSAVDLTMKKLLNQLNIKSKEKGYEVHCVSSPGSYVEEIKSQGLIYHEIYIDRKIHLISNIKSIVSLYKLFKVIKPDLVHVHTPIASVLGRIASKLAGVPTVIYTAHGFYFHDEMGKLKYNLFYTIEKYIGKYFTDYIFTQSKEDFDIAKKGKFLNKKNEQNYVHISNGVDLTHVFNVENYSTEVNVNLRRKYDIKEEEIVISFIGRQVREKGIFDLLDATNYITSSKFKLLIIGGVSKDERDQDSAEKIKQFANDERVIFTGHIDNIAEHLFMSDIFCLPSYREGMPRSIIEAMAMKNAILATNIRGSREEVVHGETGFLFPTNSSESIAKYINELINNQTLLESMKQKGLERAIMLFDEEKVIEKQLNIFSTLNKN